VAAVAVASAALSRQHLTIARRGDDVVVRDLGSRNGTLLRGLALVGEAIVRDAIEVRLGKEVPLVVRPSTELPGAVALEIAGARYVAPLGPARMGGWSSRRTTTHRPSRGHSASHRA
jgi:pSer/pThr/pTyr-binding forkhead associated (FHA) protein